MQRRDFMLGASLLLGGLSALGLSQAIAAQGIRTHAPRRVVSSQQKRLVAVLAERVIPRTDTPGAIDAGVPEFINAVLADWYTDTEFAVFADGLTWLDATALQRFQKPYLSASEEQQCALLAELEAQALDYQLNRAPKPASVADRAVIDQHAPFFTKLKELVVVGYYTSEAATRGETLYLPVPNRYSGDATLADSQGRQYVW